MSLFIISAVYVDAEIVFETQACKTPNNEEAYCLPIKKCSVFIQALKNLTDSKRKFMFESLCKYVNKKPHVCCGPVADYRTIKNDVLEVSKNVSLLPTFLNGCGQSSAYKIVYGNRAQMTESLHNALLEYTKAGNSTGYHCGGSLINYRYVLTAAHCLVGKEILQFGDVFQVRLGEYVRDNENDCNELVCGVSEDENCCTTENYEDFQIEEIIIHPDFNFLNPSLNDIALIRLNRNVTSIGSFIEPICLPRENNENYSKYYVVSGWAISGNFYGTTEKLKGAVVLSKSKNCGFNFTLTESQICTNNAYSNATRFTDSGGSLIEREIALKGIESLRLEHGRGVNNTAVLYTNVYYFMKWITENLKP